MTITIKPRTSGALATRPYDPADQLAELREEAMRALVARLDGLGSAMKQRPMLAIGIGLAVGYVLARALHRD